ncbi:MAG: phage tail tape measure protein, partial [Planctomycetota bacterium]
TQQTKQQLDSVGKSTEGVGQKAAKGAAGVDKLSGSASKAKSSFGSFFSGLMKWAAGLIGITAAIAAVTKAINIQKEALKEHARIAEEQQKKLLKLQAMGEFYKERPQLRKEVAALAEFGVKPTVKPTTEVIEAYYTLRSQAGRMTRKQRMGILRESLELGRMYPEAPLTDLVNMFTLYAKATRAQDINQVQNVLLQTITEAGAGMAPVSRYMPMFLGTAMTGGLTGAQAAGLWAYATTLPEAGGPEKATTALRNVLLTLQGKGGPPEAQKMLKRFGVKPGMGFFEQMNILAAQRQAGKFGLPEAELLAQREGASMLLGLLAQPEAMRQTIANVVAAGAGGRDITAETLRGLMAADEFARLEEKIRQDKIAIENIKGGDIKPLRWKAFMTAEERKMREAGMPDYRIRWQLWNLWLTREAVGESMEVAPGAPIINNFNITEYNSRVGYEKQRVTD